MKDVFSKIDDEWAYKPLLWACAAFITFFILWASFTKIHEQVRASGRVIPAGKTRSIQHLEGGIINEILVQEGESVKKGDDIFFIKNQRAESELQELQIALDTMRLKQKRFEAELDESESIEYSEESNRNYPSIVQSETDLFQARRSEFEEALNRLQKQMKQKVLKLDELNSTVNNLQKELDVAREQLEIRENLRQKGVMSRSQYLETVSTVRDFETRISKTQKEIPIVKSEIAELSNVIGETRQKRFSEIGEELNTLKVDIRKTKERLETSSDLVSRTAVKSPVDGVINKLFINTIGGVIQPGGQLAEIIPINETLIVEGRIGTNDRGKVYPGLPVIANITAYDYTLYGGLDGELTYISANSFIDNQNQEYYQINVSLDANTIGEDFVIYPGMTAEINIITGEISIMHAILKPFFAIRNTALREK